MQRKLRLPSWELGECPIPSGCYFSPAHADRASSEKDPSEKDYIPPFFECSLHHVKGEWAGQPVKLTDWQRQDIREIFGRVDEHGYRIIRQVYEELPKKNGKSLLAAGVGLKLLFADRENSAEVYGAAADIYQANIIFEIAASMVRRNPELRALCQHGRSILESTKRIAVPSTESYYRALTAEVAGKHGFNSHGVIFDEVHCQPDERLWEVLTFGAGAARRQPLVYAITTAGIKGESPVAERLHAEADAILRGTAPCPPSFYPILYGAQEGDDWADEEVWRAINPALGNDDEIRLGGPFLRLSTVRQEYEDARRSAVVENSFRRLRLNQWVSQESRWIRMEDWARCGGSISPDHARRLTWYGGLDLSTKLDITAFVLCALDGNGILWYVPYFWIPQENLQDRPSVEVHKYREWIKRGYITATPGNAVDFGTVRDRIKMLKRDYRIQEIAFDPMFATQLSQELEEAGCKMVDFHQGYKYYTEAMNGFETALKDGNVRHGDNPVLNWMADCVRVKQRADGAIRPVKPDRKKTSARIDGIVAALMATGRALLHPPIRGVYQDAAAILI